MNNFKFAAQTLKDVLSMESLPVGVKFFEDREAMTEIITKTYNQESKYRYCQALMKARYGDKVVLHKDNIACPASAAAFGFKPLAEKLRTGDMLFKMGLFASREAARRTMDMIPRLELGRYQAVVLAPLDQCDYNPDVIIVESETEHIMWLALASYFDEGGRLSFNSAIFQATCVDSTVVPFQTNNINASFGCFGCREATNIETGEALIGIPLAKIDKLITNLEALNENAIPRSRSKEVYKRLN